MSDGWIKIHRQLCDNPIWTSEPFTDGQAWIDLLLLTNHKEGSFNIRGIRFKVNVGECAFSQIALSQRWKWSRGKVRRFLNYLEQQKMIRIVQQKNKLTTLISICNYTFYQSNGTTEKRPDKTTNGTTDGHQTDINKKNKEEEEEFDLFWDLYDKKTGRNKTRALWDKLSKSDKLKIVDVVPVYIRMTPDSKYRKDPATWLNGKHWEDEIFSIPKKQPKGLGQ